MKINVYVSAFPVLSETFILNQITGLIDRGHEVHIVAGRAGETDVVHADVKAYNLMDRLSFSGDSYRLMPVNKAARLIKALRMFVFSNTVPRMLLLRALNIFRYGKDALTLNLFYRAFHERQKRFDADIAHCHFGQNGELVARLKHLGATRAAVVTTFHGHDLSRDLTATARNHYRYVFEVGSLCLPVSAHWQQKLESSGCRPERIQVHRMGIDTQGLADAREARPAWLSLLSVARFVEKKGLTYAISAFARVAGRFPEARYSIIGDGPLRDELLAQVQAAGLQDRVQLLAPMDGDGVRQALATAGLFLLPSVTAADGDKEGIPVVLMEAMACGLPVVSTFHSGIPELVDDRLTGFLVPERDVNSLAECLTKLLSDAQLAQQMGAAGRLKIRQEFDITMLNDRLVELFEAVL
jgi:colanic acid/amylovoran biosynthesis glycosyltransferase